MLENAAIEVGPSRRWRALGVLLIAALAIAPAAAPTHRPVSLARHTCSMSTGSERPHRAIRTRADGVNPRYLQRDLHRDAVHAR
jgi:hypothetical protein